MILLHGFSRPLIYPIKWYLGWLQSIYEEEITNVTVFASQNGAQVIWVSTNSKEWSIPSAMPQASMIMSNTVFRAYRRLYAVWMRLESSIIHRHYPKSISWQMHGLRTSPLFHPLCLQIAGKPCLVHLISSLSSPKNSVMWLSLLIWLWLSIKQKCLSGTAWVVIFFPLVFI